MLRRADLQGANLQRAMLARVDLRKANLRKANLQEVYLMGADLEGADLQEANLEGADLSLTMLIGTNLERADVTGCRIYGISAWKLKLDDAKQTNLIISDEGEPVITVDNIEVAQFIYLLLNNEKIRDVIDTIGKKAVLILGRFTSERKAVLDAIREELRLRGWLPILFDFDKPSSRNLTETVRTLAHMARFIIADITEAKSIPQELYAIVPHLPSVPVQPLLAATETEYGMFESIRPYPWVLPLYRYEDQASLLASLQQHIIAPAEEKAKQLQPLLQK